MIKKDDTITCICCPIGCKIKIKKKDKKIQIDGAQCKRGKEYAIQEVTDPRRILTTTVHIVDGTQKMLPVRSEREIPKDLVKKSVKKLSEIKVKAPVKCGDIVYKNILNSGVNIIATRDIERVN